MATGTHLTEELGLVPLSSHSRPLVSMHGGHLMEGLGEWPEEGSPAQREDTVARGGFSRSEGGHSGQVAQQGRGRGRGQAELGCHGGGHRNVPHFSSPSHPPSTPSSSALPPACPPPAGSSERQPLPHFSAEQCPVPIPGAATQGLPGAGGQALPGDTVTLLPPRVPGTEWGLRLAAPKPILWCPRGFAQSSPPSLRSSSR